MNNIEICKASVYAQTVADCWKVVYWSYDNRFMSDAKSREAHDSFHELAEIMGYRVELKE